MKLTAQTPLAIKRELAQKVATFAQLMEENINLAHEIINLRQRMRKRPSMKQDVVQTTKLTTLQARDISLTVELEQYDILKKPHQVTWDEYQAQADQVLRKFQRKSARNKLIFKYIRKDLVLLSKGEL